MSKSYCKTHSISYSSKYFGCPSCEQSKELAAERYRSANQEAAHRASLEGFGDIALGSPKQRQWATSIRAEATDESVAMRDLVLAGDLLFLIDARWWIDRRFTKSEPGGWSAMAEKLGAQPVK